jgi:hypothetical protein
MLTHNQRTEAIRLYRAEYKRQVHRARPWKAENVAQAFTKCGEMAQAEVAEWIGELDVCMGQAVREYIKAWRLENGLGLDQQELQLREVA